MATLAFRQDPEQPGINPGVNAKAQANGGHGRGGEGKLATRANCNNLLNFLGYALSIGASYLGGVGGWFGGDPIPELNSRYQTIITPSATYFRYVWAGIYLSEGFFAIAQLLPRFREQPLVQGGVGPLYFLACAFQVGYTVTFGYEIMPAAFCCMFLLAVTLLAILSRQWTVVNNEAKKTDTCASLGETTLHQAEEDMAAHPPRLPYWLLRFPFCVHAGWIAMSTPVSLCVVFVSEGLPATYELWVSVISLPLLFGGCMGLLLREESGAPSYAFPFTVAYACASVCWELTAPSQLILERHDEATINLMKNLSGFCGVCLVAVIVARFFALLIRDQCIKWNKKEDVLEIDGEEYYYVQ